VNEQYAGRQVVGWICHRRRSVLVRMTDAGERLETVRISVFYGPRDHHIRTLSPPPAARWRAARRHETAPANGSGRGSSWS
jgi:hypothetical protein